MIAEGEVLQLTHRHQPDVTEAGYLNVIRLKTAKLFEAGAQLGAILAEQPTKVENALARYGLHLGTAFQLVDDILDYQAESEALGKNLGDDLAEGKATLPLIYALKNATAQQAEFIKKAIIEGKIEDLGLIQEVIVSTGAIDYTMQAAKQEIQHAKDALAVLPASVYQEALNDLASFAIARGH
jgi:octaprenyl-diphosphate synthase